MIEVLSEIDFTIPFHVPSSPGQQVQLHI